MELFVSKVTETQYGDYVVKLSPKAAIVGMKVPATSCYFYISTLEVGLGEQMDVDTADFKVEERPFTPTGGTEIKLRWLSPKSI